MVVNHLQNNSTKTGPMSGSRSSKKSDKKSGNFEDILSSSTKSRSKRKKENLSKKSPVIKKKTYGVDNNSESIQKNKRIEPEPSKKLSSQGLIRRPQSEQGNVSRVDKLQASNKLAEQKGTQSPGHIQGQKQLLMKAENEGLVKMEAPNEQSQSKLVPASEKASFQGILEEQGYKAPLSKEQSVALGKTLEQNEKTLVQDLSAKQMKRETSIFQPNNQAKKSQLLGAVKKPDFKIDPNSESKTNQASELLENLETLKSKVAGLADDQKGLSQDDSAKMDNMLTNVSDAEVNIDQLDKSAFADKLAEVDGQSGKSEKIDNLNSIVKQARVFIKDGGGEMQIELSPEGLGKIQLKVNVENGRAQVEMLADNQAARTALEDGLAEMKLSLEGQKLIVDHLKVEMSHDYERDFSQLKDNAMEQEQREFAQQFLNQFRDEKNERWDGMSSGFKNYSRPGSEPELALQTKVRGRGYLAENKGRSLNVVA